MLCIRAACAVMRRLSVCLSVRCLSRSCIVSKRVNIFFDFVFSVASSHTILQFFNTKPYGNILSGT